MQTSVQGTEGFLFFWSIMSIFHQELATDVQEFAFLPPNQLSFVFQIIALLTGVRGYLIMILICISLMIRDAEHVLIFLLVICMSLLFENWLFRAIAHLKIRLIIFCY
jgi:hypothetical protein